MYIRARGSPIEAPVVGFRDTLFIGRLIIKLIKISFYLRSRMGSGYRAYIFKESTRHCTIDRKGRGRKEVIYLGPRQSTNYKLLTLYINYLLLLLSSIWFGNLLVPCVNLYIILIQTHAPY